MVTGPDRSSSVFTTSRKLLIILRGIYKNALFTRWLVSPVLEPSRLLYTLRLDLRGFFPHIIVTAFRGVLKQIWLFLFPQAYLYAK